RPAVGAVLLDEDGELPGAVLHLHEDLTPCVGAAAHRGRLPRGEYHRGHIHLAMGPGAMPAAHERAHWLLAGSTTANDPTWIREGLAPWVDDSLTGAPPPGAWDEPYNLYQLARHFDHLPDPGPAYRESLQLVRCIAAAAGDDLQPLLAGLARGLPFYSALAEAVGLTRSDLERCLATPVPPPHLKESAAPEGK